MKKVRRTVDEEIAALKRMKDEEIDLSDIPERTDFKGGVVGRFYRGPAPETITVKIDADVLAWLKSGGPGYQTRINKLLREAMENQSRAAPQTQRPPSGKGVKR